MNGTPPNPARGSVALGASERGRGRPTGGDVLLPERAFYWGVIEGATVGDANAAAGRLPLDEAFEKDLPEPFDNLAVRYAPIPGAIVGCAMRAERAREALESGAIVLRPKELPAAIRERVGGDADRVLEGLNFLVDEHEPAAITRLHAARRRTLWTGAAASLALLAGGLWLRSEGLDKRAEFAHAATNTTLVGALPTEAEGSSSDAAIVRLHRELEHLERARGSEAEKARLRDAAEGLAALLAAWPTNLETRVGSVQVAANQITLLVDVPDAGAAESLSKALQSVAGWNLQPPRTEIAGGQARINAILRPVPKPAAGATPRAPAQEPQS